MASKIKDLIARLRRPNAPSADLAAALHDARGVLAAAEAAMAEADRAYSAGLLEHDAEQLQAIKVAREAATIDRDRAAVLVASLQDRLVQAEAAEAAAAFEARRAAVDAEAERVAAKIRNTYPKLAGELVALLKDISKADRAINAMNQDLVRSGVPILADVQRRALPQPKSMHAMAPSIWGNTILQPIDGFAPGWEVTPYNMHEI